LFEQAQTMIKEWTQTLQIQEDSPILERAKSLAYRGSLTEAINTAAQIAPGRALYGEARNAIKLWESERAYIWAQESAAAAAREEALTETDVEVTPAEESAPSDAPESFEENPPPEPDYSEPIPDSELPPPE
jgi:hypothetical protein